MKKILFVIAAIFILSSCSKDDYEFITVASEKYTPVSILDGGCYQSYFYIKKGNSNSWEVYSSTIEGLDWEVGYEYVLKVKYEKYDPLMADAPDGRYILVEILTTVKKDSDVPLSL